MLFLIFRKCALARISLGGRRSEPFMLNRLKANDRDRCQLACLKAKQQQTEAPLWLGQGAVLSLQTLSS
jgi:hypothetical protein